MLPKGLFANLHSAGLQLLLLSLLLVLPAEFNLAAAADAPSPAPSSGMRETRAWDKSLSRGTPVPAWVDASIKAPEAVGKYPLTVRLADTQIHVDKDPVVYVHRQMIANESSMLSTVANIEIVFQPEYQHVDLHAVRVLRAGQDIDKTATADVRFLQREPELDSGIYTGTITAVIVVDDVRTGDTVDLAYSITGQNPVFAGRYFHSVYFDSMLPTQYRHVSIDTPRGRTIHHRVLGSDTAGVKVTEDTRGDRTIAHFSARDLAPVDYERYAPPDAEQFRVVQFSEFSDWRHVAQWASALFENPGAGPAVKDAVEQLRRYRDPDETVQKALEFVQTEVRYFSVLLGENSHRPSAPDIVLSRRYGDCKDKSLLLVTLLKQLGFDASPVLLSTATHAGLDRALPSPLAFDHAIVRVVVQGKAYYLDPTRNAQFGPLSAMGQSHSGADVLIVRPDSDRLAAIPVEDAGMQRSLRTERVVLRRMDGAAELTVVNRYAGLDAEMVRYYASRQTAEQMRKGFVSTIARRYPGAELVSGPMLADDKAQNALTIELHFRIPNFLETVATGWRMRYETTNLKDLFYLPDDPRRHYAVAVPGFPGTRRYEMEVTLPAEVQANYKPSESTVKNAAFIATERLTFQGNMIKVAVEVRPANDRVPVADVAAYMADLRKLDGMLESSLTVRKTDLKGNAVATSPDIPLKERIAAQLNGTVARTSTRIMEASSPGAAAADLCDRALAYAQLGRRAEALADAAGAGKADVQAQTLLCLAQVSFHLGDMKESVAYATRALGAGIAGGQAYLQRGLAYYASARWKEAAEDLEQAYERLAEPGDKTKADILRVLALRRANPRAKVASHIEARDEWPAVVLGVLDGSRSDEDVLREIHHRIGDELEYGLADAYFYLGQNSVLAGNRLKASVYLQRSVDKGIVQSELRPVARKEVEQLRK
jgi:transglutaminase-like putative cysteine protease